MSGYTVSAESGQMAGPSFKLIVGLSLLLGLTLGFIFASIEIGFDNRALAK